MITLKLRAYSKEEINFLYDVLEAAMDMVMSINCEHNCKECAYRHLCIDLQSAQLYTADNMNSRQGI